MKSTLLEVVIRPPITTLEKDEEATGRREELRWELLERVLARVDRKWSLNHDDTTAAQTGEISNNKQHDNNISSNNDNKNNTSLASSTTAAGINKKLGMNFENVGGLDTQLDDIAR
eukprot:CCRYP_006448-RA/>CCRYP_006448-RA protein AED:0.38 eAED:0.38 QI:0/0/0/1/1/1/2/0/115